MATKYHPLISSERPNNNTKWHTIAANCIARFCNRRLPTAFPPVWLCYKLGSLFCPLPATTRLRTASNCPWTPLTIDWNLKSIYVKINNKLLAYEASKHMKILPGQESVLQDSVNSDCPEQVPPFCSVTHLWRLTVRCPPSQPLLHLPWFHELHWQSTEAVKNYKYKETISSLSKNEKKDEWVVLYDTIITWTEIGVTSFRKCWKTTAASTILFHRWFLPRICSYASSTVFATLSDWPWTPLTINWIRSIL